jgi:hypothetical protein
MHASVNVHYDSELPRCGFLPPSVTMTMWSQYSCDDHLGHWPLTVPATRGQCRETQRVGGRVTLRAITPPPQWHWPPRPQGGVRKNLFLPKPPMFTPSYVKKKKKKQQPTLQKAYFTNTYSNLRVGSWKSTRFFRGVSKKLRERDLKCLPKKSYRHFRYTSLSWLLSLERKAFSQDTTQI